VPNPPKPQSYIVRFSSDRNFQAVIDRVVNKAKKATDGHVSRKTVVLAGLIALKSASKQNILTYRSKLVLGKNAHKDDRSKSLHKAVQLSLNDTALAKSLLGHVAFELRIHDLGLRELYHLGIYRLDKTKASDLATLIYAADAMREDLNSE